MFEIYFKDLHNPVSGFNSHFLDLTTKHSSERKLAFAFILCNFTDPNIRRIIDDSYYFEDLHFTSGEYFNIYFIRLNGFNFKNYGLYDKFFETTFGLKNIDTPAILFFQTQYGKIIDNFLLSINKKNNLENSFKELRKGIEVVTDTLRKVEPENFENRQEIFTEIKRNLESLQSWNIAKKVVKSAPFGKLIGSILNHTEAEN